MTERVKDYDRWSPIALYPSQMEFDPKPPLDGIHSVAFGHHSLDVLVRDRRSSTTLVTFHASTATGRTYPVFVGESISRKCNMNLIAVADPSLQVNEKVKLAWFLGTRETGYLPPVLAPMLDRILHLLGTRRSVFWGSSGGAFAAVNIAQYFDNSVAVAVNPRLDLRAGPRSSLDVYLREVLKTRSKGSERRRYEEFVPDALWTHLSFPLNFELAIYQNSLDSKYFNNQYSPFLRQIPEKAGVWVQTSADAPGHVGIPRANLIKLLRPLAMPLFTPSVALRLGGFRKA